MKAFLLLPLLLASCVHYHDMYQNDYVSVGGDADVTFPGGGHMTHSHTASLQHVVQGVTTLGATWAGAYATQSNNTLSAVQGAQALKATAIKNPVQSTTQSLAPDGTTVLTNTTTKFAPVFGTHK